jgi:hypothetical protein
MKTILFVDKSGRVKEVTIKHLTEDNLYKRANTITSDGFQVQAWWTIGSEKYTLYGKTTGASNAVCQYEFPPSTDPSPPIPNIIYGHCLIVATTTPTNNDADFFDTIVSTSTAKWDSIHESLFGGFISIESSSKDDDDKEEDVRDLAIVREIYKEQLAKMPKKLRDSGAPVVIKCDANGYICDGFVVSDTEEDTKPKKRNLKNKKESTKESKKEHKAITKESTKEPKATTKESTKEPKATTKESTKEPKESSTKEPKATTKATTKESKATTKESSTKEPKATTKEPNSKKTAKPTKRKPIPTQAPMYISRDTEQELVADDYI